MAPLLISPAAAPTFIELSTQACAPGPAPRPAAVPDSVVSGVLNATRTSSVPAAATARVPPGPGRRVVTARVLLRSARPPNRIHSAICSMSFLALLSAGRPHALPEPDLLLSKSPDCSQ